MIMKYTWVFPLLVAMITVPIARLNTLRTCEKVQVIVVDGDSPWECRRCAVRACPRESRKGMEYILCPSYPVNKEAPKAKA
jgi:hypothetical protein